jgi:hypothetical protein
VGRPIRRHGSANPKSDLGISGRDSALDGSTDVVTVFGELGHDRGLTAPAYQILDRLDPFCGPCPVSKEHLVGFPRLGKFERTKVPDRLEHGPAIGICRIDRYERGPYQVP